MWGGSMSAPTLTLGKTHSSRPLVISPFTVQVWEHKNGNTLELRFLDKHTNMTPSGNFDFTTESVAQMITHAEEVFLDLVKKRRSTANIRVHLTSLYAFWCLSENEHVMPSVFQHSSLRVMWIRGRNNVAHFVTAQVAA